MNNNSATSAGTTRTVMLILLPILGIAFAIAIALFFRKSGDQAHVAVVVSEGQPGVAINTGGIIDATGREPIVPQLGYRYKVFVEDESDDRSSGIATIGRMTTFIPEARRGMTAIVDVTRVRERVVDAILVNVLSEVHLPPKPPRAPFEPRPGDAAGHVMPGAELDVVIVEASEKNPTTEGVAKVAGLVVFVNGATTIGERVNVRITDRRERMAFAEPTGKPAGTDPLPTYAPPARAPRTYVPRPGDSAAHVVPGAEMDVVVTEPSEKNPTGEGIARIGGLVVSVKGVTTLGERVNVRIVERLERIAFAEPTGNPPGTDPLPTYAPPVRERAPRAAYVPPADDSAAHVVPGAEMDVLIVEASEKNPLTEGVAKSGGLVIFVNGATTIGERVNIRITDRRERMAFAMPTGRPAGTDPLPVEAPPPPRAPRNYVPGPGDSAPHVVPGAVIATTIVEPSSKNPTTEGIAKIDGFVIFVKGATTPGQAVNVRITERSQRVASGEVTTDPVAAAPATPAAVPVAPAPAPIAPLAPPPPAPVSAPAAPPPAPAVSAPATTLAVPAPVVAPVAPAPPPAAIPAVPAPLAPPAVVAPAPVPSVVPAVAPAAPPPPAAATAPVAVEAPALP